MADFPIELPDDDEGAGIPPTQPMPEEPEQEAIVPQEDAFEEDLGEPTVEEELWDRLEEIGHKDEDEVIFPARVRTDGTMIEQLLVNGSLSDFTAGRFNDTTSTLTHLSDGQGFALDMPAMDASGNHSIQPVFLPNPAFGVYVTQVAGANGDDGTATGTASFPTYTYNVYADAAKTILLGGTLTVEWHRPMKVAVTAGTHGLFQWNGTAGRLLQVDEYFDRDACP